MKKRVNKGLSILLSVALLFAMLPSFSGLMASAADTETSGRWDDQEGGIYKYVDFTPFLQKGEDGNIIANAYGNSIFDTSTKKYTISTAEQLAGLMVIVNDSEDESTVFSFNDQDGNNINFLLTQKQSFEGKTIELSVDEINLSAHEWVPIGKDYDYTFKATVQGKINTATNEVTKITGMKIGTENFPASYDYAGFIGRYGGKDTIVDENTTIPAISNVGIAEDSAVYIKKGAFFINYVGGIAGATVGTITISNCYNEGTIIVTASNCAYVGGMTGYAEHKITIRDCYNTGAINATATSEANAGGIVGWAEGASITIRNCYNTGAISATATSEANAGGVVGYANDYNDDTGSITQEISNCYNTGAISGSNAGGILGFDNIGTTISNCYYIGAEKGVGNKEDEDYTKNDDVQLKKILKEAEENLERDENGKMYTTLTNGAPTKPIANTSANSALRAENDDKGKSQKLGADFEMVYYFELEGTKEIIVPTVGSDGNLVFPEGKTGTAKLRGIKVTQNKLTGNGYTGDTSCFYIDLNKFLNGWTKDYLSFEASGTPRWYYYKDSEKLTGWQEVQAAGETGPVKRYYFNPARENSAQTGWMQDETGSWYYFAVNNYRDNAPLKSPAEGLAAMWTGWANDGGAEWYYLDAITGKMHTGWTQDGGAEWYYLDVADGNIKLGWQFIDGKWYYFTDDKSENMRHYGQMQTGWQLIDGSWYYFYADGAMAANTLIDSYRVDENGRWVA